MREREERGEREKCERAYVCVCVCVTHTHTHTHRVVVHMRRQLLVMRRERTILALRTEIDGLVKHATTFNSDMPTKTED